jgi:predicted ATPase
VTESALIKQFRTYFPTYSTITNFTDEMKISSTYSSDLVVYGHKFHVPAIVHGRRIAQFSFEDICNQAYGSADYIDISKLFHIICVVNIPSLSVNRRDEVSEVMFFFCLFVYFLFIFLS